MTDTSTRQELLSNLREGDIVHAEAPNGASLICLITRIDYKFMYTRTVTTNYEFRFRKDNGREERSDERVIEIDSIAPLPPDTYGIMLGLDRKYRLQFDVEQHELSADEWEALRFVQDYYKQNPLPRA